MPRKPKAIMDVSAFARQHTAKAVSVLYGIMTSPKATDGNRIAAAEGLLNRGWGKAPQALTLAVKGEETAVIRHIDELFGVPKTIEGQSQEVLASSPSEPTHKAPEGTQ